MNSKITFLNLDKISDVFDLNGLTVLPGFIDVHIHTRNPGYEYKEKLACIDQSLLFGGYTYAIAQSNIDPLPSNLDTYKKTQKLLDKLTCNVIQAGRISENNKTIKKSYYWKNINFFTDDGESVFDPIEMTKALELAAKFKRLLILHEQSPSIKGITYHSKIAKKMQWESFNHKYESSCIKRDLNLNKTINAKLHIQHISTIQSLKLIAKYKKKKMPLTCEVTPHHLSINNQQITDSGKYRMNPPLGNPQVVKKLIQGFKTGLIDIIATDHAPHSNQEKNQVFQKSLNGIIGLESAFGLIYKICLENNIPLSRLVSAMSINPGKLINIDNTIKEGNLANLTIVDLNKKWIFKSSDIKSKAKNTPFIGTDLIGKVTMVIINGKLHHLIK